MRDLAEMEREVERVSQHWRQAAQQHLAARSTRALTRKLRRGGEEKKQDQQEQQRRPSIDWVVLPPWYDEREQVTASAAAAPPASAPSRSERSSLPPATRPTSAPASPTRVRSHLRLLHSQQRLPRRRPSPAADLRTIQSSPQPLSPHRSSHRSSPSTRRQLELANPLPAVEHSRAEAERIEQDEPIPTAPSSSFLTRAQRWQSQAERRRHQRKRLASQQLEQLHSQLPFRPAINPQPPPMPPPVPPTALLTTRASLVSFSHTLNHLLSSSPHPSPLFHPHLVSAPLGGGRVERSFADRTLQQEKARRREEMEEWRMGSSSRQLVEAREWRESRGDVVARRKEEGLRMKEKDERGWTFRPRLSHESRALTVHLPTQFHARQRLLEAEEGGKEEGRRRQRQVEEKEALSFQPALPFDVRREKAMEDEPVDVAHRLHGQGEQRRLRWSDDEALRGSVRRVYAECSFTPRINPTSALLARVHHGQQPPPASASTASAPPSFQPRINATSHLLSLSTGSLQQHQAKSTAFQRQLREEYQRRRELELAEEAAACTFSPETVEWDREAAELELAVHGVDRFLQVRGWAAEQRRWKAERERHVFLIDAAEGPGRRGCTLPREFHLETNRRGAREQARIAHERQTRRNRPS